MAEPFVYGGQTILSHPIFVETILPFLLIFTIVFAVLQKAKILGEGKRQIDAIVALVVGLLFISFAQAVGIAVLYFTNLWQGFLDMVYSQGATGTSIFANAVFVIIMAAAIVAVIIGAGKAKKD